MSDLTESLWEAHQHHWRNCIRCKLADTRLNRGTEGDDDVAQVPMGCSSSPRINGGLPPRNARLHVLYPCPDSSQSAAGTLWGRQDISGSSLSPMHGLMQWSWASLGDQVVPFSLDDMAFSVALGCRPVSFSDPRKLMAVSGESGKACRHRWQFEVLFSDPDMLLLCGKHALMMVRPDLGTKHSRMLGEIVSVDIPTPRGAARYEGYVAPSPEEVVVNARDDQYDLTGWEVGPEKSHVDQPVRHWLWHVLYAGWLSRTLADLRAGRTPHPIWGSLQREVDKFYDGQTTVRALADREQHLLGRILDIAQDERSGRGVRSITEDTDDGEEDED